MFLAAILLLAIPSAASVSLSQGVAFFRIGAGSADSTYFAIGGLLANAISNPPGSRACEDGGSCGVPGLIAVAQSTDGAVFNVEAIGKGDLESGLAQADIAYWAFNGFGTFAEQGQIDELSAIASLYPESIHIVVRADSDITDIGQLRGRKVSLGPVQSGSFVDSQIILEAYGLSLEDIDVDLLMPGTAIDKLRTGEVDAVFLVAGYPVRALSEFAKDFRLRLLPIDGETAERLVTENPFFSRDSISADVYKTDKDVETLNVRALWIASAKLDDELVYGITRALWHTRNRKLLDNAHPDGLGIQLETALVGLTIPLHPGAERYYREAGLLRGGAQDGAGDEMMPPQDGEAETMPPQDGEIVPSEN
ncbi:MAG: TAXI family TRAP transporter solute-binding subunit [Proteobacteria bacterium]|nr:TAXI family TRAP transporter solute-binding subunit [Pseudomonadota bacterium]